MASVADSHDQIMVGKKVLVQGQIDRDVYGQFRDLCASHKLTIGQGLSWALRNLLGQAGVKTRPDRGERSQTTQKVEAKTEG